MATETQTRYRTERETLGIFVAKELLGQELLNPYNRELQSYNRELQSRIDGVMTQIQSNIGPAKLELVLQALTKMEEGICDAEVASRSQRFVAFKTGVKDTSAEALKVLIGIPEPYQGAFKSYVNFKYAEGAKRSRVISDRP